MVSSNEFKTGMTIEYEDKIYQIDLVIETSIQEKMISLNRSLANLVKQSEISLEMAQSYSLDPAELSNLLAR